MKTGTVPIAVNLGIAPNEDGYGSLFKPNENYLMLRYNYTPKQYGEKINKFLDIPQSAYEKIARNNFELIKKFDRKVVAQDYIDLAEGKDAGVYGTSTPKFADPAFERAAEEMWQAHFDPPPAATLEDFFS
jgi:hypothetical protein